MQLLHGVLSLASRAAVASILAFPAYGQAITQEEALREAFPEPATIERRTAFLSDAEFARVQRLAGRETDVDRRILTYYVGHGPRGPLGVAYFDAHRVRTLNEVLMVVVGVDDDIRTVEVLRFLEPPEYRAPDRWLEQFQGARLDETLSTKGRIVNMTGATLTSRAAIEAARRILAYHHVIAPLANSGS